MYQWPTRSAHDTKHSMSNRGHGVIAVHNGHPGPVKLNTWPWTGILYDRCECWNSNYLALCVGIRERPLTWNTIIYGHEHSLPFNYSFYPTSAFWLSCNTQSQPLIEARTRASLSPTADGTDMMAVRRVLLLVIVQNGVAKSFGTGQSSMGGSVIIIIACPGRCLWIRLSVVVVAIATQRANTHAVLPCIHLHLLMAICNAWHLEDDYRRFCAAFTYICYYALYYTAYLNDGCQKLLQVKTLCN